MNDLGIPSLDDPSYLPFDSYSSDCCVRTMSSW